MDDEPVITPQKSNKKLYLIIGISIVSLLIMSALGYLFFSKNSPLGNQSPAPKNKNLTIAGNRYLDPCHLLPAATAEKLFGTFNNRSYARQEFIEDSVKKTENDKGITDASCSYKFGDSNATGLDIKVEYFNSNEHAAKDWQYPLDVVSGEERRKIEAEIKADPSPFAAAIYGPTLRLLAGLESDYKGTRLAPEIGPGVIFGPGKGGFGSRMEFEKVVGNTIVRLSYDQTLDSGTFTEASLKPFYPAIKQAFESIEQNSKNSSLAQHPLTATPLGGNGKPAGDTTVLAPCEMFSADIFKKVLGKSNDPQVEQKTVDRGTPTDVRYVVSSECNRRAISDGNSDYAEVTFTFAKTPEVAKNRYYIEMANYQQRISFCTVTELNTSQGTGVVIKDKDTESESCGGRHYALVRYGSYIIQIDLRSTRDREDFRHKDSTYTAIANDILAYIKKYE